MKDRGRDSRRKPSCEWSIFRRAGASMLTGRFESSLTETSMNGATVGANVRETWEDTVPVVELGAGIAWRRDIWTFAAGYELTHWSNMADALDFTDDVREGKSIRRASDLALDGFFLRLGLGW
ncbi:MAG: Lpg1974 family pore-forming outer membrane protein [Planctomycetales bacterium]